MYAIRINSVFSKIKFITLMVLPLFGLIGCSEELSHTIRNQNNCALISGDRVKIIDGNIVELSSKALLGEIFKINADKVKIIDANNISKEFFLKIVYKDPSKRLLALMIDGSNIFLACGID
jgi:hypothetical protein